MPGEGRSDMDAFMSLAKKVVSDTNEAGRKKVLDTLRDVAYSIESPEDTIQRVMFYVSSGGQVNSRWSLTDINQLTQNLQIASVRVGVDLKLFDQLTESESPMTVEQLSAKTSASPLLLGELRLDM